MPKGLGSNPGRRFGFASMSRPMKEKAKGIYPDSSSGAGEYGSVVFSTITEAYNRESDYKRWKLGQEYYFGKGRTWGDQQLNILARFLNGTANFSDEINQRGSREVVTIFPTPNSPEKAWYVATRVRGSFLLPQPITAARVTLNQSDPDPTNHTLVLDVSGIYNAAQLAIYNVCIGDQFEDSASGPNFPDDLVEKDAGSVALTLIDVSTAAMTMTFDLSRPHRRVEINKKIYWKREPYDPEDPEVPTYTFKQDGTRYLCSSFSFFCCCPDHLGGAVANLDYVDKTGSNIDTFPLPNANRSVISAWESEGVGYYRQWRTLPNRRDERRDCKHIHAQRWACGVPWYEPSDYPTAAERDLLEFMTPYERAMDPNEFLAYFRKKRLSWDRFILSIAESVGLVCFPGGDVRENIRPFGGPMLWHDSEEPNPDWCRNNDWWLQRGTQNLQCFNQSTQEFQTFVPKSGVDYSILSFLELDAVDVPKIVP
tara:strand:- start:1294 stop:2739 length:1446 start_codon:yes stop_codon:yes gene_type:complete